MSKRLVVRYIFLLMSVAVMVWIFVMSAQNAAISSQSSGRIVRTIAKIVVEDFEKKPIDYQINLISTLQFFVRKSAHFAIYTSLGFSFCGYALTFDRKNSLVKSLIAFAFAVLYAISDEFHQFFVRGRSAQVSDILLDSFGIIFGIIIVNCLFILAKKFILRGKRCEQ